MPRCRRCSFHDRRQRENGAMLGRVGSGAAVAALPWAAAIVAATQGSLVIGLLFGLLTGAIMLWAYAPVIPRLRNLVPGVRRVAALEAAWVEGHRLFYETPGQAELRGWFDRRLKWERLTGDWIKQHISEVEAG